MTAGLPKYSQIIIDFFDKIIAMLTECYSCRYAIAILEKAYYNQLTAIGQTRFCYINVTLANIWLTYKNRGARIATDKRSDTGLYKIA